MVVTKHLYRRDPHSGAGNCVCGWPERWGDELAPIHFGPKVRARQKVPGLKRALEQVRHGWMARN